MQDVISNLPSALVRGSGNKMKRCEFFIIYNTDAGKNVLKVKGYMFEKSGHWFTVRHRRPDEKLYRKKWIVSDFVTGLVMAGTDNKIEDVPAVISETMVSRLLELYKNNTIGIYENRSIREGLQSFAEIIYQATYKRGINSNMLDLLKDQAYELFN